MPSFLISSPPTLITSALHDGLYPLDKAYTAHFQEMNVILAHTYEYREPSDRAVAEAAEKAMGTKMSMDMTSRYMGLVVIPGQHIVSMSVEEFASQLKGANSGKTIHSRAADNY